MMCCWVTTVEWLKPRKWKPMDPTTGELQDAYPFATPSLVRLQFFFQHQPPQVIHAPEPAFPRQLARCIRKHDRWPQKPRQTCPWRLPRWTPATKSPSTEDIRASRSSWRCVLSPSRLVTSPVAQTRAQRKLQAKPRRSSSSPSRTRSTSTTSRRRSSSPSPPSSPTSPTCSTGPVRPTSST